jgi:class 3 adenylate cyclase
LQADRSMAFTFSRFLKILALLAFLIAGANFYSAFSLLGRPFAGLLPGANLLYMNLDKGFEVYEKIVSIDGKPLKTNDDLARYLATREPGTQVTFEAEAQTESFDGKPAPGKTPRRDKFVKTVKIYGLDDLAREFLPSLLVGLAYLLVGTIAFWLKSDSAASRAHLYLTLALGLSNTVWVEWWAETWPANAVQPINETLVFLGSAAGVHLSLVFPWRRAILDRAPWLIGAIWGMAAAMGAFATYAWADNLVAGRDFSDGFQSLLGVLMSVGMLASWIAGYGLLIHATLRGPSGLSRRQARVAVVGGVISVAPVFVTTVAAYIFGYRLPYSPLLYALQMGAPIAFPIAIAYAIIRHKLFDIDLVIKRTVCYGVVAAMLCAVYFGLMAGIGMMVALAGPASAATLGGTLPGGAGNVLATAAIAVMFGPLRDRCRALLDARFFRGAYSFDKVVSELGETLRQDRSAKALLGTFLTALGKALHPEYLVALFRPEGSDSLVLVEAIGAPAVEGLVVGVDHPAIEDVRSRNLPLAADPADFGDLRNAMLIPLHVGGRLAGAILAGPRKSGLEYDEQDRLLLATLAQQFEKKLEQDELDRTDAEASRARAALSRYVSVQVADTVLQEHFEYREGRRQDVTLLFSDIRGFTKMSESLPPEDVVSLLNGYFSRMVQAVFAYDGMLDKYIGDGMMVVFGAPVPRSDHAWRAAQAALRMRHELSAFNAERTALGKPALKIGIGLHSGEVVIGNIGTEQRLDFTAIGDTVNTASRIESLTKDHDADILVSAATYERIADRVAARHIPGVAIRGRAAALDLYALEGISGHPDAFPSQASLAGNA